MVLKIKKIREPVNTKFDIRTQFIIADKKFGQLRFPTEASAKKFIKRLPKNQR